MGIPDLAKANREVVKAIWQVFPQAGRSMKEALRLIDLAEESGESTYLEEAGQFVRHHVTCFQGCSFAGFGDMQWVSSADESVTAASLNAGVVTKTFRIVLQNAAGKPHIWLNGPIPMLTAFETVADAGVAVPVVSATPFRNGASVVTVKSDTGGTYIAAETYGVHVQSNAGETILGESVPKFTRTYTVS